MLHPDLKLIIVQDNDRPCCLATVQTYEVGYNLSYIPVKPLYDLVMRRKNKKSAALLLSIFCWLFQIVKIPWFTDSDSYLGGCYEILKEWCETPGPP